MLDFIAHNSSSRGMLGAWRCGRRACPLPACRAATAAANRRHGSPSHLRASPPPPPPPTTTTPPPADIEKLTWTKASRGGVLNVKLAEGPALRFMGFRDKVRGLPALACFFVLLCCDACQGGS